MASKRSKKHSDQAVVQCSLFFIWTIPKLKSLFLSNGKNLKVTYLYVTADLTTNATHFISLAVQTPPLVQLIENNGKRTGASSLGKGMEIIHRRIDSEPTETKTIAPDISIVNAKCPDTCAPNNHLDDRFVR